LLLSGCTARPTTEGGIERDVETYVRLVLALAERDPDSLDSYFGPPAWQADARARRESLADIRRSARELFTRIATPKKAATRSESRNAFLTRQLRAIVARVDAVTGAPRPFAEESRLLFGVEPPPIDRERIASARAVLDRLLPGQGDLTRRLASFEKRFVVAPDLVPAVLVRAIDECRRITREHVALPPDERADVTFVRESPWPAFTRYAGHHRSRVTVNASVAFTVDDVLQLACHETYPGHHTINVLVDDRLVRAEKRIELTAQLLFSPQALLTEGAASVADRLAFARDERLQLERTALYPLAGIDPRDAELSLRVSELVQEFGPVRTEIAERYIDGRLEFARAAAALERDGLMPYPDATLKFLNEFRTFIVTYVQGPALVSKYLDARAPEGDGAARWRAYVELVTTQALEK
jgi:hypothetical protein